MRRLTLALAMALAIATSSCKRAPRPAPAGPDLLSVVQVDDPAASAQLVSGFYSLEGNPWRWTAGKFSAELKPPSGAGENGAKLELKLNIRDLSNSDRAEIVTNPSGRRGLSALAVQRRGFHSPEVASR